MQRLHNEKYFREYLYVYGLWLNGDTLTLPFDVFVHCLFFLILCDYYYYYCYCCCFYYGLANKDFQINKGRHIFGRKITRAAAAGRKTTDRTAVDDAVTDNGSDLVG